MLDFNFNRRDFLKRAGLGAVAVATIGSQVVIGKTKRGYLVESEEEYGDFIVEKLTGGEYPYQVKPEVLKRMKQKFTIFSRNSWDPKRQDRPELDENLRHKNLVTGKGVVPNNNRLDYAFMAASWATSTGVGATA